MADRLVRGERRGVSTQYEGRDETCPVSTGKGGGGGGGVADLRRNDEIHERKVLRRTRPRAVSASRTAKNHIPNPSYIE